MKRRRERIINNNRSKQTNLGNEATNCRDVVVQKCTTNPRRDEVAFEDFTFARNKSDVSEAA